MVTSSLLHTSSLHVAECCVSAAGQVHLRTARWDAVDLCPVLLSVSRVSLLALPRLTQRPVKVGILGLLQVAVIKILHET